MTTVEQLAVVDSLARARWEALAESADVAQCARKFITKCMLPHVLPFAPLTRAEERKVRSHPIVVFSKPSVGVCCRLGVSSLVTLVGGRTARDDKKNCAILSARGGRRHPGPPLRARGAARRRGRHWSLVVVTREGSLSLDAAVDALSSLVT